VSLISQHKIAAIVLALFLRTTVATAQIPTKGDIFFGYSYARAGLGYKRLNLNGWNGSVDGKLLPWVGIVADISGHYGSEDIPTICLNPSGPCPPPVIRAAANVHSFSCSVPRLSLSVGKATPFVHALFGAAHLSASGSGFSDSQNSFATAPGGGIDYLFTHGIGWRVQADLLHTRFFTKTQNDFRFSTGLVLRF